MCEMDEDTLPVHIDLLKSNDDKLVVVMVMVVRRLADDVWKYT